MEETESNSSLSKQLRQYHEELDVELGWKIVMEVSTAIDLFISVRIPPEDIGDVRESTLAEIGYNLAKIQRGAADHQIWQWCYTIARRQIAQYYQKKNRAPIIVTSEAIEALSDAMVEFSFESEIHIKEALAILKNALPECFRLLWDRYVVGIPVSELASQDGCKEETMRKRILRCRGEAREVLVEGGAYGE